MNTDPNEVETIARQLYRDEVWQVGMPSWENASWDDRALCRERAERLLGGT